MNGLRKHAGQWHDRRAVAVKPRPTVGTPEGPEYSVQVSLGTDNLNIVLRRLPAEKARIDRLFAEADASLKNPASRPTVLSRNGAERAQRGLDDDAEDALDMHLTELLRRGQPQQDEDGNVSPPPHGEQGVIPVRCRQ